jgi:methyl-accepting chemotaxis protein
MPIWYPLRWGTLDRGLGVESVDVEAIESALQLIVEGRFDSVPAGSDRLGRAVRGLADKLQLQSLDAMNRTVAYSIALNEEVLAVVALGREVHEIAERGNAIAGATQAMTGSVGEVAEASEATFREAQSTAEAALRSMQAAERTATTIETIAEAVDDATRRVETLSETSTEIADMARSVEAIARQTNMLALNAAIEATRAGAAGRGFAVVADEVKKLANQTREVAAAIRSRTDTLRKDMAVIVSGMESSSDAVGVGRTVVAEAGTEMQAVSQHADRTADLMRGVTGHVESQRQTADSIAADSATIATMTERSHRGIVSLTEVIDQSHKLVVRGLSTLTTRDIPNKDIHLAMSDHMLWRKRLAQTFIGRDGLRDDELRDPKACRFGRWYYGEHRPAVKTHSVFALLDAPNRAMHEAGAAIVDHLAAGRMAEAIVLMERVAEASTQILCHLGELANSLGGGSAEEPTAMLHDVELF